jgi:hypothetical protein
MAILQEGIEVSGLKKRRRPDKKRFCQGNGRADCRRRLSE